MRVCVYENLILGIIKIDAIISMLILLAILILLVVPIAMLFISIARPKFAFHWVLALFAALISFILVLLSRSTQPGVIWSANWQPVELFSDSPTFILDTISWTLALSLIGILVAVLLTAVTRQPGGTWRTWSGILILACLGLLSVLSGNPLTLILSWSALDSFEVLILLSLIRRSETRQRIVSVISARVVGTSLLIWASILTRNPGENLGFREIPDFVNLLFLLSAGLRLGVLPLHPPFLQDRLIRKNLGTPLRLVPVAASFMLLVRSANFNVPAVVSPWLLALVGLAGLYGSFSWLSAGSELSGRPFWILGTASLSVAAAIRMEPMASLAWGLVCLLCGGLLFLSSARSRYLMPLIYLGVLGLTALPMTPAWPGMGVYSLLFGGSKNLLNGVFDLAFGFTQVILILGAVRHLRRPVEITTPLESWAWFFYAPGLVLLLGIFYYLGWQIKPELNLSMWQAWSGGLILIFVVLSGLFSNLNPFKPIQQQATNVTIQWTAFLERVLSLEWFYHFAGRVYHFLSRIIDRFTDILEGEGGILWAMVILILLYTISQQIGLSLK